MPGEAGTEFLLLQPMVPAARPNMIAWIAARNDAPNYGKVRVYRFPQDTSVRGPTQIEAQIDADPMISSQISLWDQSGSKVVHGNLIVLPCRTPSSTSSRSTSSRPSAFPQFQKIVVATSTKVVWGNTLQEALDLLLAGALRLRGGGPTPTPTLNPSPGARPTPSGTPGPGAPPRLTSRDSSTTRSTIRAGPGRPADGDFATDGRRSPSCRTPSADSTRSSARVSPRVPSRRRARLPHRASARRPDRRAAVSADMGGDRTVADRDGSTTRSATWGEGVARATRTTLSTPSLWPVALAGFLARGGSSSCSSRSCRSRRLSAWPTSSARRPSRLPVSRWALWWCCWPPASPS